MNRRFWNNMNRMEESIIHSCTSLKVRVEMRIAGMPVAAKTCASPQEADMWINDQKREYKRYMSQCTPVFVKL